jgi:hypothetical protein
MKIPNVDQVIVDRAKMVDYLLSDAHPVGRHKAVFFRRVGFTVERWEELADALRKHAAEHEIAREEASPFGRRLVVEGIMESPDGRTPRVRSVWFLRFGENVPRFVSAYPLKS